MHKKSRHKKVHHRRKPGPRKSLTKKVVIVIELRNKIERQKLETEDANHDLQSGLDALDQYHKLLKEQNKLYQYKDKVHDFNQYYHPSEEFENYLFFLNLQ